MKEAKFDTEISYEMKLCQSEEKVIFSCLEIEKAFDLPWKIRILLSVPKSVLHLFKYKANLYLSRCSTDLQ